MNTVINVEILLDMLAELGFQIESDGNGKIISLLLPDHEDVDYCVVNINDGILKDLHYKDCDKDIEITYKNTETNVCFSMKNGRKFSTAVVEN